MRKLLLASAAILGATGGLAQAQPVANPSQGQMAAPYGAGPSANNNNNAWGTANTPTGGAAAGPLSSIYPPNVDAVPAPGTVVIRLNGRVEIDVGAFYSGVNTGLNANGTPNGFKSNPIGIASYMRLYPGFDGTAANGIRYGAAIELRENFQAGNATNFGVTGTTATSPSTNSSLETVFVRRAFTYLASDQAGIVRFGQGDGVLGLFDNCIFTSACWDAGVGNFNGGPNQVFGPQGAAVPFVWLAQAGAEYDNSKVVYLSPQFFGLDFGIQYAPNMGQMNQNGGVGAGCNQAGPTCISVTSGNDSTRWINQLGAGLRYQHTFGPMDVKLYGFYETSGRENITTSAFATTAQARVGAALPGLRGNAATTAGSNNVPYDDLNFYKAGAAITALNFTAAIDYIGGAVNGQLGMRPEGGANENAILTGLTYANGPIVLGAEIGMVDSQGDARLVGMSQRHEYEIAFGGNYKLAPGVQLVGEYMYQHRHQGGFDFNTGALGAGTTATAAGLTRDVQSNSFLFATVLTW
jgi:Gram-negative porin